MFFKMLFLVTALLLGNVGYSSAAEGDNTSKQPEETKILTLQALADSIVQKGTNIPGIVLLTCTPDGKIDIAASGYGDIAKKTPVDTDSQFFIGSISKNMVAVLIFKLHEKGLLSLDDPLSKYVEWPRGNEITIRMLLNHTSGIPDYLSEVIYAMPKDKIVEYFSKETSQSDTIEPVKKLDFKFDPGTKQEYSNTNGVLAGLVVEKVTGKSLGDILNEEIFKPLKMEHSYLYGVKTRDLPHVRGYCLPDVWTSPLYDGLVDVTHADENIVDAADGTIVSTAGDLLIYHQALRDGKLISKESFDVMRCKETGLENGLGYILVEVPFGNLEGMMGKMHGCSAGMIYHVESGIHYIALSNSSAGGNELQKLLMWKMENM